MASLHATGLALLFFAAPAVAQQDYSATITETLEEPEYIPDVSPTARSANAQVARVWRPSCDEVRRRGLAPLYRGQPGYHSDMDGDGDGVACETQRGQPIITNSWRNGLDQARGKRSRR